MTGPASPDPPPPVDLRRIKERLAQHPFAVALRFDVATIRALVAEVEQARLTDATPEPYAPSGPPGTYSGRALSEVCATCGKTWGAHAENNCDYPPTDRTWAAAPQRQEPPSHE
jgi:hypothetical protein